MRTWMPAIALAIGLTALSPAQETTSPVDDVFSSGSTGNVVVIQRDLKKDTDDLKKRMDAMEQKLAVLNDRIGKSMGPSTSFNSLERRLTDIERRLDRIERDVQRYDDRIRRLENKR